MRISLLIAVSLACVASIAAGLVEGRLSNRWGEPPDMVSASQRLAAVPKHVGNWQMQSSEPFEESVVQMLQCSGHFTRVYVNSLTGESVAVAMLVGPPGPTSVHIPEVCYSSRGQTISETRKAVNVFPDEHPEASLWRMTFRSNDVEQNLLRVWYGWSGPDGPWQAATNPRFEYGGQPFLFKIQLAGRVIKLADKSDNDPCLKFLQDFLPALDATVFHPSSD